MKNIIKILFGAVFLIGLKLFVAGIVNNNSNQQLVGGIVCLTGLDFVAGTTTTKEDDE